ncbi:hypothetical protein LTR91_021889 [Friedmanniomyces endolithicus]|uniref:Phospholipase D-like domain-containing protein n=1 Tax=Friedmanniomyces endolithicus TaxID=329885 RepID=A0AAN6H541_9PEZI|nr:hypothetical protein LTR57_012098 [Friedmanniomyces endolithicus]KAK0957401.1 hypothetical protein LTR91_021889 [Friedmanniomyces endolithicus]KAK1047379.1 hypothetical protein LTS16_005149 [Friedmanniomyces endolithicus]
MPLNLISNENSSLSLLERIRARLDDPELVHVDILISYIMKSGVDLLGKEFEALQARNVTVRILTTCQHGISDFEGAVEWLARLKRFEIKVFTPNNPTFHAKGWRFEYRNGVSRDAIIVGSSNLSRPALTTGQEFNIEAERGESDEAAKLIAHFKARFDDYWQKTGFVSIPDDNFEDMRNQFKIAANGDHFLQGTPFKEEYDTIMQRRSRLREEAKQWNEREKVNKHSRSNSVTDAEQDNVRRRRLVDPAIVYPLRDLEGLTLSTSPAASSSLSFEALPDHLIPPLAHRVMPAAARPQVASIAEAVTLRFNAAVQSNDVDDLDQILSELDALEQVTVLNTRREWSLPFTRERAWGDGCAPSVTTYPIWPALMRRNYPMLKVMLERGALLAPITIYRPERDTQSTYHPLIILTSDVERDLDTIGYPWETAYDEGMKSLGIAIMMIRCPDFDPRAAREVEENTSLDSLSPPDRGLIRETSALGRVQEVCRCCHPRYARYAVDGVVPCFYEHELFFMTTVILLLNAGARPDPSRASCHFMREAETQYKNMREGRAIELRDVREGDNRVEEMLGRKVVRKVTESRRYPDKIPEHILASRQAEYRWNARAT